MSEREVLALIEELMSGVLPEHWPLQKIAVLLAVGEREGRITSEVRKEVFFAVQMRSLGMNISFASARRE